MPNRGSYDRKLSPYIPYVRIQEGYHDGTGVVQAAYQSYKIVIPTKKEQTIEGETFKGDDGLTQKKFLGSVTVRPIPDQYQDVTPVTATAEDVRAGKVFVDAEGNAVEGALAGTIADVSGVTATAANVLQGKTIVDADGNEVEGSIPVVETSEVELTVQTPSGAIPVGYYANGVALSVAAKSAAVTPTKETQNLADSFYDSITVDPIPEEYQNVSGVTATAEDVVAGKVIVDAQGNEVVGTLAPGGGGSLPAGLYWQNDKDNMPPPTRYAQKHFMFNGNIYSLTKTASTGSAKKIYKFENGAWVSVADGTISLYECNASFIEFNGKVHIYEEYAHSSFDGKTITNYAKMPNGSCSHNCAFIEDGKLKCYSYSTKYTYVWDEETDTWTQENNLTFSKNIYFFYHNNKVYCVGYDTKGLYEYKNGTVTLIGTLLKAAINFTVHKNYLYYIADSTLIYKISLEDGANTELGRTPNYISAYTANYYHLVSLGDEMHLVGVGSNYSGADNLIMHEVTE